MKNNNLLLLLLLNFCLVKAQTDPDAEKLNIFQKNSFTYIILEDSAKSIYNDAIKYAVEKYWDQGEVKYVTKKEFKEKKPVNVPYIENKNEDESFMGSDRRVYVYTYYIGLYFNDEKNRYSYIEHVKSDKFSSHLPMKYMAILSIKQINKWLNDHKTGKYVKPGQEVLAKQQRLKKIQQGTLFISMNDLTEEVDTPEKIKKYYPYKVKIVADEDIYKLIDSKEESNVFVLTNRPPKGKKEFYSYIRNSGTCEINIRESKSGAEFYVNSRRTKGFTGKDFTMIAGDKLSKYAQGYFLY